MGNLRLVLCSLLLLIAIPNRILAQDAPAGIPAEWLVPIGGGAAPATTTPAADTTTTNTDTAAPALDSGATAGAQVGGNPGATPSAVPATSTGAAVGGTTTPATATDPNMAGGATTTPTTTDPNAAGTGTTATPAVNPNAGATTATPAVDPNAGATTTAPVTDPNAANTGAAVGGTTSTTPTATPSTTTTTDPNAGAATGAAVGGTATPTPTATANPPAEAVVIPPQDQNEEEEDSPAASPPIPDNLPPGPPADWKALPVDTQIIFGIQLDGPYLAPWTKSKSWVFTNVLADRYLRSVDVDDIETGPLDTKVYNVPKPDQEGRRKMLTANRRLMQDDNPGAADDTSTVGSSVLLRVKVNTNNIRVESEVRSVVDGISSGTMARDLSMALGAPVDNITLTAQPITQPYDFLEDPNASTGGSLPGWIIGCIVGAVLVLMPVPAYIMYKRHKKKHLEAVEKQQAEAAAARQRMQSRIIKSSGKSFTGRSGSDGLEHDILARTGSMTSYGGYTPGPGSMIDGRMDSMTRQGSFMNGMNRSLSRMPSIQQQRYQEQSLGPGGMPSARASSFVNMSPNMSFGRGAVLPVRGSDEASTSSGNLSERRA